MKDEKKVLIDYRLERAHGALAEAKLLFREGFANTFVNRLYYACFYAVSALLLSQNLSSSKHSGVRSLFYQNFIKTGSVRPECGHLYDRLFDNRQKGDYADLVRFELDKIKGWYEEAENFVSAIERLVKE